MRIVIQGLISVLFLLVVAFVVPGIEISSFFSAVVAFLILTVINFFIKPIIKLITLPLNILTLGILGLVINVLLFWLLDFIVPGFSISNFWSAAVGLLLFSMLQAIVYGFD